MVQPSLKLHFHVWMALGESAPQVREAVRAKMSGMPLGCGRLYDTEFWGFITAIYRHRGDARSSLWKMKIATGTCLCVRNLKHFDVTTPTFLYIVHITYFNCLAAFIETITIIKTNTFTKVCMRNVDTSRGKLWGISLSATPTSADNLLHFPERAAKWETQSGFPETFCNKFLERCLYLKAV